MQRNKITVEVDSYKEMGRLICLLVSLAIVLTAVDCTNTILGKPNVGDELLLWQEVDVSLTVGQVTYDFEYPPKVRFSAHTYSV